jgi:hypothetical protein
VGTYPDDLDIGLELAGFNTQGHVGFNASGRLEVLAGLRKLPPPLGDSPRVDLAEADVLFDSDLDGAFAAARRAQDKARARGAKALLARGHLAAVTIQLQRGHHGEALAAATAAKALFVELGDRDGIASVLLAEGYIKMAHGEPTSADALYGEAERICRELGDGRNLIYALWMRPFSHYLRGELGPARAGLEELRALAHERGFRYWEAHAVFWLGDLALAEGDALAARRLVDEAMALAKTGGVVLTWRDDPWDLLVAEDRLDDAVRDLTAIVKRSEGAGKRLIADESSWILGRLLMFAGRPAAAETMGRAALDDLARLSEEHTAGMDAPVHSFLAWTLAAQGHAEAALAEAALAEAALPRAAQLVKRRIVIRFDIGRARSLAGDTARGRANLRAALDDATAIHDVFDALDIRLELAKLNGDRRALAELAAEARRHGFVRVARLAGEAAKP